MKVLIVAVIHVRGLAEKPGLIAMRYITCNDVEDAGNSDVDRHLNRHLPGRRAFWAERCAWMAATLKDSRSDEREEWLNFALVARELAGAKPLAEIPLFDVIAEATVDAFAGSTPTRRQVKPRGR